MQGAQDLLFQSLAVQHDFLICCLLRSVVYDTCAALTRFQKCFYFTGGGGGVPYIELDNLRLPVSSTGTILRARSGAQFPLRTKTFSPWSAQARQGRPTKR